MYRQQKEQRKESTHHDVFLIFMMKHDPAYDSDEPDRVKKCPGEYKKRERRKKEE
jgi:hypothetical protein